MLPSNATCLWVVRLISALLVLYSKFFLCFGADFFENCNIWDLKVWVGKGVVCIFLCSSGMDREAKRVFILLHLCSQMFVIAVYGALLIISMKEGLGGCHFVYCYAPRAFVLAISNILA